MVSALEGRGLVFDYPGPLRAVDGVDIAVQPGELLVVIGPNGSGKSTLLKLLAALLPPRSGEVLVGGRPLGEVHPRERAQLVAVVPQSLPVLPEVTAERFVLGGRYARVGSRATGVDRRAVTDALAAADVADLATRPLTDLSGGQRQRVLVARALAQEARILLVDEPTTALDAGHQVSVFALLARLVRADRCAVVVTHDLNLASQFASRVLCLDGGRVVTVGAVAQVLNKEVLTPVYGEHLYYGQIGSSPFVLPWLRDDVPHG